MTEIAQTLQQWEDHVFDGLAEEQRVQGHFAITSKNVSSLMQGTQLGLAMISDPTLQRIIVTGTALPEESPDIPEIQTKLILQARLELHEQLRPKTAAERWERVIRVIVEQWPEETLYDCVAKKRALDIYGRKILLNSPDTIEIPSDPEERLEIINMIWHEVKELCKRKPECLQYSLSA